MRLSPIEETLNLIEIKEKNEQKCAITGNGFITVNYGNIDALYAVPRTYLFTYRQRLKGQDYVEEAENSVKVLILDKTWPYEKLVKNCKAYKPLTFD